MPNIGYKPTSWVAAVNVTEAQQKAIEGDLRAIFATERVNVLKVAAEEGKEWARDRLAGILRKHGAVPAWDSKSGPKSGDAPTSGPKSSKRAPTSAKPASSAAPKSGPKSAKPKSEKGPKSSKRSPKSAKPASSAAPKSAKPASSAAPKSAKPASKKPASKAASKSEASKSAKPKSEKGPKSSKRAAPKSEAPKSAKPASKAAPKSAKPASKKPASKAAKPKAEKKPKAAKVAKPKAEKAAKPKAEKKPKAAKVAKPKAEKAPSSKQKAAKGAAKAALPRANAELRAALEQLNVTCPGEQASAVRTAAALLAAAKKSNAMSTEVLGARATLNGLLAKATGYKEATKAIAAAGKLPAVMAAKANYDTVRAEAIAVPEALKAEIEKDPAVVSAKAALERARGGEEVTKAITALALARTTCARNRAALKLKFSQGASAAGPATQVSSR